MLDLESILLSEDVVSSINDNLDMILAFIPEIRFSINFDHKHPHHHLDVWEHTLLALSLSKQDFDVRLTLLLHDIGKPFSYTEGEVRHFNGHPKVSAEMSKTILKRLGYEDNYIDYICYLISHHDYPITLNQIQENIDLTLKLYEVQRCDALAHNPEKLDKRKDYLHKTKEKILGLRK